MFEHIKTLKSLLSLLSCGFIWKVRGEKETYRYDNPDLIPIVRKVVDEGNEGYCRTYPVFEFSLYTAEEKEMHARHRESKKELQALVARLGNDPTMTEEQKRALEYIKRSPWLR